jgi:hypothetical protein
MTEVPHVTLNDGTNIPQLGFGVFQNRAAGHGALGSRRA